jgi:hypothetical protein
MPRELLDLSKDSDLKQVGGVWRYAQGLVPGQPNEGLEAHISGSPARLPDYDDSDWDTLDDFTKWISTGLTFYWYRTKITIPDEVEGVKVAGGRCVVETCIDDYGEVWIDGELDLNSATVQGFNKPQRVIITNDAQPGDIHTIALLAINGPLARPGGGVFVRYVYLGFEWPDSTY